MVASVAGGAVGRTLPLCALTNVGSVIFMAHIMQREKSLPMSV